MEHVRLAEIAEDVERKSIKLGLDTEGLAGKAGVGPRFIRNLGKNQAFKRLKHFTMLLSVLVFLDLVHHEQDVRTAMQSVTRFSKARRRKIDRRQFGRVCSRRGRR